MANIMINDICNLKCPYCFAQELSNRNNKNITMDNFEKAIDFVLTGGANEQIGLIGGEPTLHPQFDKILEYLNNRKDVKNVIVFTNGIKINKYLDYLNEEKFSLLVNCNSSKDIGDKNYQLLCDNLIKIKNIGLNQRVCLGINVYKKNMDYNYIFELLKCANIQKLRLSIAVPNYEVETNFDYLEYYKQMKNIVIKIIMRAIENDILPFFDCNQLPICFVTNNERNNILKCLRKEDITNIISLENHCAPVIDILQDLRAVRCMGLSDVLSVKINDFKNINDLRKYFETEIDDLKYIIQNKEQCEKCYYAHTKRCSSGCLCYKKKDILRVKKTINEQMRWAGGRN